MLADIASTSSKPLVLLLNAQHPLLPCPGWFDRLHDDFEDQATFAFTADRAVFRAFDTTGGLFVCSLVDGGACARPQALNDTKPWLDDVLPHASSPTALRAHARPPTTVIPLPAALASRLGEL